jgi:DNA polymerase III subunit alpha
MQYSHLHCHTQYSLLDGAAKISAMFKKAAADKMPAIAITDHGNMFGVFEFVAEAAKHKDVKPIVGCEFYLVEDRHKRAFTKDQKDKRFHQLFLAKNAEGYRNLTKMCSLGFIEGLYGKYPRIDKELILQYHKGLIATTCCLGAEVPQAILTQGEAVAREKFKWWLNLFGEDYYVELQRHKIPDQIKVNEVLLRFAKEFDVKIIASNDSHYVDRADSNAHDILLCLNTGEKQSTPKMDDFDEGVSQKGKRFAFFNDEFYFKTTAEMQKIFPDLPQALDNTNEIVAKIEPLKLKRDILLPNFVIPQGFVSQDEYLTHLTYEGAKARYKEITPQIEERLNFELFTVKTMGFAGYFLIVADFIKAGRDMGVFLGPGRGSAAGSAIAYCIGITNIDPIKYNLLFERFLNPDRKSMPDIDTDFDDEGRQKVIDYVVQKYGKQQVAQITTYGTMAAKMSIKDVSRVLDLPLQEANAMAKLVSDKPGIKLNRLLTAPIYGEGSLSEKENLIPEDIENAKMLREILEGDDDRAKVLKEALILEGSVRGTGIHAAGIIIAPRDLTDIIPVYTSKETELLITQFEGSIIEDAGVIKMDFLGLKTLSIMRDALKLIKENYGIAIEIDEIPLDDKKTYQLYQRGETNATFQFESPGMQKHLRDLKPDKFDDLIAMNALYRPGPLQYIPNYINRKHGREKVVYDLDAMEEYLHETYGICITGDTLIYNPITGERARMDSLENRVGEYYVQGVDNQLNAKIAPITHWVCNGKKAIVEVKLKNGSTVKMTHDHRVLTETGWQEIGHLKAGDFIATPRVLIEPATPQLYDRKKLRVLAYLLADGSISGGTTADFVSKDDQLIEEYTRCLSGFDKLESHTIMQIREVTRVTVAGVDKAKYHEPNSLLAQLREWGLKTMKGGCASDTKFIPEFVFQLSNDDIAYFLASYWDCDGHVGKQTCHIKTISRQIATGIQTLLLKLGIYSRVYESSYYSNRRAANTIAYQITVFNLKIFDTLITPYLVSKRMPENAYLTGIKHHDNVSRDLFLMEFKDSWQGTYRGFMDEYGFDRQHFLPKQRTVPRIPINVIEYVSEKLDLVQTRQNSNVRWVEIKQIVPIGEELVYDITVADIHNFIGNNIILHNCIFQEQLMLLSQKLANFSKGDADVLRKAMGKKQLAVLDKMKPKFLAGCEKNGHSLPTCEKVWTDWEAFASYAFNKSHSTCYAFVAFQTGYLKAHYPGEYMAAVLTHGQGNLEKITFFMEECRSMGIAVKSPDVNESDVTFTVNKKGAIRYALAAAKGVGEAAVAALIEERKTNGAYKDVFDFVRRSNSRTINKKVIESLVYAGALDGFGIHRATYFAKPDPTKQDTFIEMLIKYGNAYQSQKDEAKVSLFGGGSNAVMTAPPAIPKVEEWNLIEKLNHEKEVVGIFLSGHPLDDFRMQVKVLEKYALDKLDNFKNQKVKIAAFVTAVNERISKKGTPWGAITIQDYKSSTEFTLFNDDYARHAPILKPGTSVYIEAEYKTRYNSTEFELKINQVKLLDSVSVDNLVNHVTIVIPLERITQDFIDTMSLFCSKFKGKSKLKIQIQDATNHLHLKLYSLDKNVKIDTALLKYMDSEGWQYALN